MGGELDDGLGKEWIVCALPLEHMVKQEFLFHGKSRREAGGEDEQMMEGYWFRRREI